MVKLAGYEERRTAQLSGGQRQRVALARALVNGPKVLLLDEPLGALDLKLREQMQEELKALQARLGITFVFVTHDQGEALSMANRVAIFNEGKIVQVGTPFDVYERPNSQFCRRLRRLVQYPFAGICGCARWPRSLDEPQPEKIELASVGALVPAASPVQPVSSGRSAIRARLPASRLRRIRCRSLPPFPRRRRLEKATMLLSSGRNRP